MPDYHDQIQKRQDIFDAFERGEIDYDEYQRQMRANPVTTPAPRTHDGPVKRIAAWVLRGINGVLARVDRWLKERNQS